MSDMSDRSANEGYQEAIAGRTVHFGGNLKALP
jgi:hypothetical protein